MSTHPDIAALVTPLCAKRREGDTLQFPRVIARYEAISMLYRATLLIGDCFVPRNDACIKKRRPSRFYSSQ